MTRAIHDFELALVDPCMAILERGVRVDEAKRRAMILALTNELTPLRAHVEGIAIPLLQNAKRVPRQHLFTTKWVCPCCRGGKAKVQHCWTCGEYKERPGKKLLELCPPCLVCEGDGKRESWSFNPQSEQQLKIMLFDLLKLPKRVRSDEETLKDLRAHDDSGFVEAMLRIAKTTTIISILERMSPGADARLRTWLNVAGTETGRFSSSETFLEASTNLQNMPKKVAASDPKYDVRDCLVPDIGDVFVEVDLSQAEARIVAALCGDQELLERWNDQSFDVHVWTAARIFKKENGDVTQDERYIGKRSRHALNYGMGWKHFQRTINADADVTGVSLTAGRARTIVDAYHVLHPRLETWWRRVAGLLDSEGTLTTPLGRRRTFFGRRSKELWLTDVHKEAIAFVPQSTVADLLNRGLLRWWRRHDGKVGRVILQVHDSILVSVPKAKANVAAKLLKSCCEEEIKVNGTTLVVPAEVSVGEESWARMK